MTPPTVASPIGLCRRVAFADFQEPWLQKCEAQMGLRHRVHRKHWEHAIVAEYFRHYILNPAPEILGFGVGREPMAAWFASKGATVLATDQSLADVTSAWRNDQAVQHAADKSEIPYRGICSLEAFASRVSFASVDMNAIPEHLLQQRFDMTWSCGSFEHLGSIEAGLTFFRTQMDCLKKNGLAIHTTEFNVVSDDETIDANDLCLFRKQDLDELGRRLRADGHLLWPLLLDVGKDPEDQLVDKPPYDADIHLNMVINDAFITTSIVLVAQAGGAS